MCGYLGSSSRQPTTGVLDPQDKVKSAPVRMNGISTMQPTTMRPTFTVSLPVPADEAMQRIRSELKNHDQGASSISVGECAELFVSTKERRIWSPQLSIQVDEAESGSQLHGRFSPRPEIWTMLMFCYFTVTTLAFFGAMLGCAQWMIKQQPWALIAAPVGVAVVVTLHVVSLIGQRLGREQMHELRTRLDATLQTAFGIEPEQ
jgi:hypothetical protein